ncbi:MAG: glycosyltransferase family 4 protein, partial [Solirubrobacteraceae bacterium]
MKPVLFATGHAPPDRVGAFARLHAAENVEWALFGGRLRHAGEAAAAEDSQLPFPYREPAQRALYGLAASGRYRAVIVSTGGRVALPAAWLGARRARVPVILWASLWAHPRTAAHALSYPILRSLYGRADAVVTYGPHVSAYVARRGAHNIHVAPQAVDNAFWSGPVGPPSHPEWPPAGGVKVLFAGRPTKEKGIGVLLEAWRTLGTERGGASLMLAGVQPGELASLAPGGDRGAPLPASVHALGPASPRELRNFYGAADVLVLPSLRTRDFREPWGLVVNEAFNRKLPV